MKKCNNKQVILKAVDLCANEQNLICEAEHDCEEKEICKCQINLFCEKVKDVRLHYENKLTKNIRPTVILWIILNI